MIKFISTTAINIWPQCTWQLWINYFPAFLVISHSHVTILANILRVIITYSGFLAIKGNDMPFPSFPFSCWMKYSGWNTDAVIGARTANSSQEVKTKYVEDGEDGELKKTKQNRTMWCDNCGCTFLFSCVWAIHHFSNIWGT